MIGLFPQYAYKFNSLMLSASRYSILSGLMNLQSSGE